MYAKLTIPERLKDLRVVDKHLTLEQLAEQTGLSKIRAGKNTKPMTTRTSARLRLQRWRTFTACPPTI